MRVPSPRSCMHASCISILYSVYAVTTAASQYSAMQCSPVKSVCLCVCVCVSLFLTLCIREWFSTSPSSEGEAHRRRANHARRLRTDHAGRLHVSGSSRETWNLEAFVGSRNEAVCAYKNSCLQDIGELNACRCLRTRMMSEALSESYRLLVIMLGCRIRRRVQRLQGIDFAFLAGSSASGSDIPSQEQTAGNIEACRITSTIPQYPLLELYSSIPQSPIRVIKTPILCQPSIKPWHSKWRFPQLLPQSFGFSSS